MAEIDEYKAQLREAHEHLSRWEYLGEKLHTTEKAEWKEIHAARKSAVKLLEDFIKGLSKG
jgi:hypothetical protein